MKKISTNEAIYTLPMKKARCGLRFGCKNIRSSNAWNVNENGNANNNSVSNTNGLRADSF